MKGTCLAKVNTLFKKYADIGLKFCVGFDFWYYAVLPPNYIHVIISKLIFAIISKLIFALEQENFSILLNFYG